MVIKMGQMKAVAIEIQNSPAMSYLWHEIKELKLQQEGHGVMLKELLTAVDLKHLDE